MGRGGRPAKSRREAEEEMWAVAVAGHVPTVPGQRPRLLDYDFICPDCGRREGRAAASQDRSAGELPIARPVRCRACRGARRGEA